MVRLRMESCLENLETGFEQFLGWKREEAEQELRESHRELQEVQLKRIKELLENITHTVSRGQWREQCQERRKMGKMGHHRAESENPVIPMGPATIDGEN